MRFIIVTILLSFLGTSQASPVAEEAQVFKVGDEVITKNYLIACPFEAWTDHYKKHNLKTKYPSITTLDNLDRYCDLNKFKDISKWFFPPGQKLTVIDKLGEIGIHYYAKIKGSKDIFYINYDNVWGPLIPKENVAGIHLWSPEETMLSNKRILKKYNITKAQLYFTFSVKSGGDDELAKGLLKIFEKVSNQKLEFVENVDDNYNKSFYFFNLAPKKKAFEFCLELDHGRKLAGCSFKKAIYDKALIKQAIEKGNYELTTMLFNLGNDFFKQATFGEFTPLGIAVKEKQLKIFEFLRNKKFYNSTVKSSFWESEYICKNKMWDFVKADLGISNGSNYQNYSKCEDEWKGIEGIKDVLSLVERQKKERIKKLREPMLENGRKRIKYFYEALGKNESISTIWSNIKYAHSSVRHYKETKEYKELTKILNDIDSCYDANNPEKRGPKVRKKCMEILRKKHLK